jgi:hypothetical protein
VPTQRAPLFPGDEAKAFKALKDSARRNIRRAERLGLVVKQETDERFVDEHYAQLVDVYRRGGHAIPFGRNRVLSCFRHLQRAGRLIAVSVWLPGERANIATGMFFHEGTELSLWMWAHQHHYRCDAGLHQLRHDGPRGVQGQVRRRARHHHGPLAAQPGEVARPGAARRGHRLPGPAGGAGRPGPCRRAVRPPRARRRRGGSTWSVPSR